MPAYLCYVKDLKETKDYYQKVIRYAKEEISKAPPGSVRVKKHRNRIQFFYCDEVNQKNGRYIPASEQELAQALVKKRYLKRVLAAAENQCAVIERFLKDYDPEAIRRIYKAEGELCRKLLKPVELPDEEYKELWQSFAYKGKVIREGTPDHYTERGEQVRSKSEVLIADILYRAGIPYRYECPLNLGGNEIHPDFTILRMSDRKELYWEHLGMPDDAEYRNEAIQRIRDYEANGIYPGDRLILSIETIRKPLNKKIVEGILQQYGFFDNPAAMC